MTADWTTQLTETLTLAWAESESGVLDRGTSARVHWTVPGVLDAAEADALRQAVRRQLDHQPVTGVWGRRAVAERVCQIVQQLCADHGFALEAMSMELEHGYSVHCRRPLP